MIKYAFSYQRKQRKYQQRSLTFYNTTQKSRTKCLLPCQSYTILIFIANKKIICTILERSAGHFESSPPSENSRWNQFDSLVQEQNFFLFFFLFPSFLLSYNHGCSRKKLKTWITSPTHALHKIGEWGCKTPSSTEPIRRIMRSFRTSHSPARCENNSLEKPHYSINQYSIRNRRISDRKAGLERNVLQARLLMSSRVQSCEIRTSSHRAPPLIMSFAFTSALQKPRMLKEQVQEIDLGYSIR